LQVCEPKVHLPCTRGVFCAIFNVACMNSVQRLTRTSSSIAAASFSFVFFLQGALPHVVL
jgi:hypothetical protein